MKIKSIIFAVNKFTNNDLVKFIIEKINKIKLETCIVL